MEPTREEQRHWLRHAVERYGKTPTELARAAGVASSTLTRLLNNDDDKTVLSFRTISKVAHAAGVAPLMGGPDGTSPPGFSEEEAMPLEMEKSKWPHRIRLAINALIVGRDAAAPWEMKSNALEHAGVLAGDILIVDLNQLPEAGKIVCAQAYDWHRGKAETLFRIYEPPYLVAATSSPAFRKVRLVDNDSVVIKGTVTDILRF